MKKIIVALCAVSLLGLTACHKDKVTPDEPTTQDGGSQSGQGGGQSDPQEPVWADIAGVYSPAAKIVAVSENGAASETWSCENDLLKTVANAEGNVKVRFTHDNQGRVTTMTVNGDGQLSGTVSVSYTGEDMTSISLVGTNNVSAQLTNNANHKITGAVLDLSNMDNNELTALFNNALAQFLGGGSATDFISGIDSVSGNIAFTWDGNNVDMSTTLIGARLKTTIGQIATLLNNDFSMFGEYASIIESFAQASPNTPLYIKVDLRDESDYTYDNHTNPLRNYMGDMVKIEDNMPGFNVSSLSANNTIEESHIGVATVNVYTVVNVPIAGPMTYQLYNTDYNLYDKVTVYTYSYRADGYPESFESNNGSKAYTYQE